MHFKIYNEISMPPYIACEIFLQWELENCDIITCYSSPIFILTNRIEQGPKEVNYNYYNRTIIRFWSHGN